MGSAVVKPLSRRRGKIKPIDSGDNTEQGNQNVNITDRNQAGDVAASGEPSKNVLVDSLADPVSNLCKPARAKKSDQGAEKQHQSPTTPAVNEKSSPVYDSDEEPNPIQLAKSEILRLNDTNNLSGKDSDINEGSDKVSFAPHIPLSERSRPPLTSDRHRFGRLSSLFRSGGTLSCPPFRSSKKSNKVLSDKEAKKQEEQTGAYSADRLQDTAGEAETQEENEEEKDVCCDARSPSPEYDKLEGIEIVNPSPKSVDHPAVQQLQNSIPGSEEIQENHTVCSLVADDEPDETPSSEAGDNDLKLDEPVLETSYEILEAALETDYPSLETDNPPYETDNPAIETDNPPFETDNPALETENSPFETDNPAIETYNPPFETDNPALETDNPHIETGDPDTEPDYPALETEYYASDKYKLELKRSNDACEKDRPELAIAECHFENANNEYLSASSSKENTAEQSFEDHDTCPTKRLDTTHDFYDRDNSKPVSESPSEDACCVEARGAHAINLCQMVAGLSRTYGIGEVKGVTPSTSPCSAAGQVCEEDCGTDPKHADFRPSHASPGRHEGTSCALLTDYVPNNPAFITHWPENTNGFGKTFNSLEREHDKESLKNNISFTTRTYDRNSECEFRNMSPIKEETAGYDSQLELYQCDLPRSKRSSQSSSAKSTGSKGILDEGNDQCKGEHLFSSSRNSLHKSLSHLRQQITPRHNPVHTCRSNTSISSEQKFECALNALTAESFGTPPRSLSSHEKLNATGRVSSPRSPTHEIIPTASQSRVYASRSQTLKSPTVREPTSVKSSTSSVRSEHGAELEPILLRNRPKSEKNYPPLSLFPNAGKTRPISASVLNPISNQSLQPTGAMKLPPINGTCSMTARPISAKQPSSKSEVFLSTPSPGSGKRSAPTSRPVSAREFAPQSRLVSASSRPCSARSRPDAAVPTLCSNDMGFDRADRGVRLSPIHLRPGHQGSGEQWSGHGVHEIEVNECVSATDLRVSPSSPDCKQIDFAEGGDGPHVMANTGKSAEDPSISRGGITSTTHSASATSFNISKTNLATSSADRLTSEPDTTGMPSWSDGQPQDAADQKETYPLQALTLSADQIGSIRQQLYEEGLKPAERDGGVAFFIPMTVDGLQPQSNGVTISDRLTRSRKSSLSYEERLILANINRQAQLHKRKEFAVKDIQNVKGAATTAEIDRSKQEDEIDADLDSSF